jgi:uncharacterized protein (TIGR02246 family)
MTSNPTGSDADDAELADIPMQMIEAWNRGDADGFATPFSETADFVAFEGTHLRGRAGIAAFHRELFATAVRGTRLEGGVRFIRRLAPEWAIVHAWARYTQLPGIDEPTPGRDSMQLFVATKQDGHWRAVAAQNSRQLTLDQQAALDELALAGTLSRESGARRCGTARR